MEGRNNAGSSRTPLHPVRRTRTIWQYWLRPGFVRAAPTLPGTTRIRLPSTPSICYDRPTTKVSHLHSKHSASRRKRFLRQNPSPWQNRLRSGPILLAADNESQRRRSRCGHRRAREKAVAKSPPPRMLGVRTRRYRMRSLRSMRTPETSRPCPSPRRLALRHPRGSAGCVRRQTGRTDVHPAAVLPTSGRPLHALITSVGPRRCRNRCICIQPGHVDSADSCAGLRIRGCRGGPIPTGPRIGPPIGPCIGPRIGGLISTRETASETGGSSLRRGRRRARSPSAPRPSWGSESPEIQRCSCSRARVLGRVRQGRPVLAASHRWVRRIARGR